VTDLSDVRKSITALEAASKKLDDEKAVAEKNFKKLLDKLLHGESVCHKRAFPRLRNWIKGIFGVESSAMQAGEDDYLRILGVVSEDTARYLEFYRDTPMEKFIKAAKRVRKDNQKLRAFEQGFISEEGIKDREWQVLPLCTILPWCLWLSH
jgi:N-acetylated-alpha-linked acidic dipeptidase